MDQHLATQRFRPNPVHAQIPLESLLGNGHQRSGRTESDVRIVGFPGRPFIRRKAGTPRLSTAGIGAKRRRMVFQRPFSGGPFLESRVARQIPGRRPDAGGPVASRRCGGRRRHAGHPRRALLGDRRKRPSVLPLLDAERRSGRGLDDLRRGRRTIRYRRLQAYRGESGGLLVRQLPRRSAQRSAKSLLRASELVADQQGNLLRRRQRAVDPRHGTGGQPARQCEVGPEDRRSDPRQLPHDRRPRIPQRASAGGGFAETRLAALPPTRFRESASAFRIVDVGLLPLALPTDGL